MQLILLKLLLFPILFIRSIFGSEAMQESLYAPDDPMLQLSYKNFNESIYNQKKSFFVEFYSSWCGHCIAFAPTWKQLAKDVTGWNKVVEIAAVNCALDSNFGLCQEHNLEGYPTLKYFNYESAGPSDGAHYDGSKETPAEMMSAIAGYVAADYEKQKASLWPDFSLAHDNNPGENLWHPDTHYLIFVFENYTDVPPKESKEPFSNVGAQALLDFIEAKSISIRRASSQHQLARANQIKQFPALLIFSRSHPGSPVYISKESLKRRDVLLKIKHNTDLANKEYAQKKLDQKSDKVGIDFSKRYFVHNTDLLSAIAYTFTHEIPMHRRITGDKLKALKQFLETLTRYFPGSESMRRLLFRMISWLNEKGESVTADEWLSQLKRVQDELGQLLPSTVSWVACKGSSSKYRGYPCSMWTLFHTLTVSAYKMDGSKRDFKPVELLESIRGYLKGFFGCRQCVDNFEKSATHMATTVKKPADVVLWLWKAHNTANGFLKGDPSEDPDHPKMQFPPKALCSYCYHQDDTFDESGVMEFLLKFYADVKIHDPTDISKTETEQKSHESRLHTVAWEKLVEEDRVEKIKELENRLLPRGKGWNGSEMTERNGNIFNGFDLSLCFVVWLASIVIVCMFCAYAKYRKGKHRFWKTLYGDLKV